MSTQSMEPVEIRARGFDALVRSLGWVNAVRFIQQYESSGHNYTAEREQILLDWVRPRTLGNKTNPKKR